MSKARRTRKQRNTSDTSKTHPGIIHDSDAKALLRRLAQDTFTNPIARTGALNPNVAEGTDYVLTRITNDYQLMNALYRNSWVVRNVIDMIPEDMTKNWIKFTGSLQPEEIRKIENVFTKRRLKHHILHGLKWGRLYGGAIGLMMIEGQEDMLDQPLDLNMMGVGSFKNLMIVDRWTGVYPSIELEDDLNNTEFGLPKYYEVQMEDGSMELVHHSRCIRFVGRQLPYWEAMAEVYWGASEVEIIYEELKKRDNMSANILMLTFMANLRFMKIDGLDLALGMGDAQQNQELYNAIQSMNYMMSNGGLQLLGKNDEFSQFQYSFAGLNDIYQSFMMDLAGACKTPVTKLFGRSPAGMNATGESDMDNYNDTIEQAQEAILAPVLDKILPVVCMSELGYVPDDLDYEFNPIQEASEKEIADLIEQKGNIILNFYKEGVFGRKTALKELKNMSESTGMFDSITDEMIEAADDDVDQGEVLSPNDLEEIRSMGAQAPNRSGLQSSNQTSDARNRRIVDWFRRSKRYH